jgi:hypothetical protein
VYTLVLLMLASADGGGSGLARVGEAAHNVVLDAGVDGGTPDAGHKTPHGLKCLARYYIGEAVKGDAGWGLMLPDASFLSWDNGRPTEPEEDSDAGEEEEEEVTPDLPKLRDIFATPYDKGPIKPVVGDDTLEDPGRARIDPLFKATYGGSWREVMNHLSKVKFFGSRYPFHERAAPALERVATRLEAAAQQDPSLLPFFKGLGGTWHWRRIARSRSLSTHAFGIAIDLNVQRSNYWRWQRPKKPLKWTNRYPQTIVDAFEAEGFIWGGRWIHYDTMHFEYRPELVDPDCWR